MEYSWQQSTRTSGRYPRLKRFTSIHLKPRRSTMDQIVRRRRNREGVSRVWQKQAHVATRGRKSSRADESSDSRFVLSSQHSRGFGKRSRESSNATRRQGLRRLSRARSKRTLEQPRTPVSDILSKHPTGESQLDIRPDTPRARAPIPPTRPPPTRPNPKRPRPGKRTPRSPPPFRLLLFDKRKLLFLSSSSSSLWSEKENVLSSLVRGPVAKRAAPHAATTSETGTSPRGRLSTSSRGTRAPRSAAPARTHSSAYDPT